MLIDGATGSSGTVAVQVAKHLGAKKITVTGRNAQELNALRRFGADVVLPFDLRPENIQGASEFEEALKAEFVSGLDVVIDYFWGTIIVAVAKAVEDAHSVCFVRLARPAANP